MKHGSWIAVGIMFAASTAAAEPEVRAPTADDLAAYVKKFPGTGALTATIATTQGTIHCELFEKQTPIAVANFVGLATGQKPWRDPRTDTVVTNKPFYDGLTFHRVIKQFMIQGGDPFGLGTGGPGYTFGDEPRDDVKFAPGSLAMANAGPSTNGSQFFITEIAPDYLQGKHTIFGKCRELDVVKKIARVATVPGDKPETPVTMKVTISRAAK